MKSRKVLLLVAVFGFVVLSLMSVAQGSRAASGFFAGTIATATSMFGTWMGIVFVGKLMKESAPSWQGAIFPIVAMVIKLPVILGAMVWVLRLGQPAPSWFLAGLALVYSVTIWWAVTRQ